MWLQTTIPLAFVRCTKSCSQLHQGKCEQIGVTGSAVDLHWHVLKKRAYLCTF